MRTALAFLFLIVLAATVKANTPILIDHFDPARPSITISDENGDVVTGGELQEEDPSFPILGGERDVFLTLNAPPFVTATVSVTQSRLSGAYAQFSAGVIQVSWDGDTDGDFSQVDPVPGFGSFDFTVSGAFGMLVNITSDHEVRYFFSVFTGNDVSSRELFVPEVGNGNTPQVFLLPYESFVGTADFTDISAIEMTISFNITAIDTAIELIAIFEYEICGTAFLDCDSDTVFDADEDPFVSLDIDLLNAAGNVVLAEEVTDASGDFCFTGLAAGSYQVCADEPLDVILTTPTAGTPGCFDVVLVDFEDVTGLLFGFTLNDIVVAPADITVECGDSTFPINTGFATGDSCGPVFITFEDAVGTGCPEIITRTWSNNNNAFSNQLIIVDDTVNPTITAPAVDQSDDCNSEDIDAWIASDGFATCSDCTGCSFINNYNGVPPSPCDDVEVTFTAVDACGNTADTTATYTTFDNTDPTITLSMPSPVTECTSSGADVASYNAWVASFGGASATDNCFAQGALTFSTTDDDGITSTCSDSDTVFFSATDPCGNVGTVSGTYTISDTLPPTITQEAQPQTTACGPNAQTSYDAFLANNGNSAAVDQCTAVSVTNDASATAPSGCDDTNTVTFFYSDECGNLPASTTASFTVQDNAGPVITTPATDLTVTCDGSNQGEYQTWLADDGGAENNDVCDGGSVAFTNDAPATVDNCSGVSVTFTATDSCGLISTTSASFFIEDLDDPTIVTPAVDETVECDNNAVTSYEAWVSSRAGFEATDACTTVSYTDNAPASVNGGCLNVVTVNFVASDLCGNSLVETGSFTVEDNTDPNFDLLPADDSALCTENFQAVYQSWLNSNGGAMGSDVCTGVSFTNDGPVSPAFLGCSDDTLVTFFLNDQCGNQDSASATFTVSDVTGPTVDVEAVDQTVVCDGTLNQVSFDNWVSANGFSTITDDCSAVTVTNDAPASLAGDQCGAGATVTFTGCDPCGRCVSTSATFTSSDNDAPNLTRPASDLTVQCDGSNNSGEYQNWLDTQGGAVAVDACTPDSSNLIITNDAGTVFGCDFVDVTFFFSDPCGNQVSSEATFTAIDNIVPTIDPPASSLAVECDGSGNNADYTNWIATRAGMDADDACALVLTFSDNSATGTQPTTCPESQSVTFTVEDECGNSASSVAVYSIIDTVDPSFVVLPANQTEQCDRFSSANVDDFTAWLASNAGASGIDTCSAVVISHNNPNLVNINGCQADTPVDFVLSDACGNTVVESATFSLVDTIAPLITTPASNLNLECGPTNSASITAWLSSNAGAIAEDGCSIAISSSNDFGVAPDACVNGDVVTFTFADLCGNSVTTTAVLTINDAEPPVFTPFPANITVGCDQTTDPSTTGSPIPVDVCDSSPSLTFVDNTLTLPAESFCPGDDVTVRTWISMDSCGNQIARDQEIVQEFALSTGPCTPSQCPPCEDQQCCEENLEPVPCNPVACTAVECTTVSCTSVPCNPVNCGSVPVEDDDEDDDDQTCDPIYIYIFDDDEDFSTDLTGSIQYIPDDDDDATPPIGDDDDNSSDNDDDDDSSAAFLKVSVAVVAAFLLVLF